MGVLGNDVLRGPRPDVVPARVFDLLVWIGIAGMVLIALRGVPALSRIRSGVRSGSWAEPTTLFLGLNVIGFALLVPIGVLADLRAFDRYLLPVLPIIAFLVLRPSPEVSAPVDRARGIRSAIAVVALCALGIAFAADSASFDANALGGRRGRDGGWLPTAPGGRRVRVGGMAPPGGAAVRAEAESGRAEASAPAVQRAVLCAGGDRRQPGTGRAVAVRRSTALTRGSMTIVAYPLADRC